MAALDKPLYEGEAPGSLRALLVMTMLPGGGRRGAGMRRIVPAVAVVLVIVLAVAGSAWSTVGQVGSVPQPSPDASVQQVDFNGDGFDDLAVGVPGEEVGGAVGAGGVNILYGAAGGLTGANQLLTQDSPGVADSPEERDGFGSALD